MHGESQRLLSTKHSVSRIVLAESRFCHIKLSSPKVIEYSGCAMTFLLFFTISYPIISHSSETRSSASRKVIYLPRACLTALFLEVERSLKPA
ncbi:hypothetical protein D3C87_1300760 [compost metagenome]